MPDKVLIYSRFPKAMMVRIGQRYDLMDAAGKPPGDVFTADQLKGVRAMITAGGTPLGTDAMDSMPALQAIVCYGTGYDGIDLAGAAARRIVVGNSPAANASSVADIAMTLMLAVTRRLLPADDYVRSGNWSAAKPSPLMKPQPGNPGRRIGIYGMGEIGRKIAARAAAFEMDVGYYSRSKHDVPYRYVPSLEALVEWCSVLMIAVRAGADTHHMIDADMLRKLGPDGYLVNISRGSVIDQRGANCGTGGQDHRGRRPRCVRKGTAPAGCADRVSECRADAAYRRPYGRLAPRDAGLCDGQPGCVFCRKGVALSGDVARMSEAKYGAGRSPGYRFTHPGYVCKKPLGKPMKTR